MSDNKPIPYDELGQRREVDRATITLRRVLELFTDDDGITLSPAEAKDIERLVTDRVREIVAEENGNAEPPADPRDGRQGKERP